MRPFFSVSSLWKKGIPLERHRPPERQEVIVSSIYSSSKEWIQEKVLLLSVTKDWFLVHPFDCLYGCHRESLVIDEEALSSYAVFQWFLRLCEGISRLVLGKYGKTTRVELRKALECLACHPRVHRAVSARHIFKGDRGLLGERCFMLLYTSKFITDIWCKNLYFFKQFCRKCLPWS